MVIQLSLYQQKIRTRLNHRLRDVAQDAIKARIEQEAQDRHRALVRHARELGITAEPDAGHPGQFVTRYNPGKDARSKGYCNLTTAFTCTCKEFAIWRQCPCQALVIDTLKHETVAERHHGTEAA